MCTEVQQTYESRKRQYRERIKNMSTFAKWTDDMVKEYFDTHLNATLHEISALSGRTRADIKRVLMS